MAARICAASAMAGDSRKSWPALSGARQRPPLWGRWRAGMNDEAGRGARSCVSARRRRRQEKTAASAKKQQQQQRRQQQRDNLSRYELAPLELELRNRTDPRRALAAAAAAAENPLRLRRLRRRRDLGCRLFRGRIKKMEEIGDRRAHRLSFVRSLVRPAVRRPARRIVRYSSAMRLLAASRAERPAGHIYVYILIFNRACGQLQVVVLLRPAAQLERDPPAPPAHLAVLFIRAAPGAGAGSAWMRGAALNLAHELAATSPFRAGWLAGWRAENIGRRRSQRRHAEAERRYTR